MLRSAVSCGAQVFERSEVVRIDAERDAVATADARRRSHARQVVVIATGYATSRFRPLAGRFRMYRTYVLATEPTTAASATNWGCPT